MQRYVVKLTWSFLVQLDGESFYLNKHELDMPTKALVFERMIAKRQVVELLAGQSYPLVQINGKRISASQATTAGEPSTVD